MKTIFRILTVLMFCLGSTSCSDDEEIVVVELDINYANLNGIWRLAEWNGEPLADGTYCYIELSRKDRTFKMYHNMDSMFARLITGSFELEDDPYLGFVISGKYDYGQGSWNNEYIITDLLETGSMIWTVNGDDSDISKYERCDAIPDNVLDEIRDSEE